MRDEIVKPAGMFGGWERQVGIVVLTIALAFFLWEAWTHFVPAYYGLADEHGYMTTAKRLALHGTFAQRQSDPYAFIGETMMQSPTDPSVYYLRQPIGYPLVAAGAYWLMGEQGPFAVNPILGIVLLLGIFRLGLQLKSPLGGAIAALVIATNSLVLMYTLAPLSHMLDMTLAVFCISMGLMWRGSSKWWQAAVCGMLVGMAVSTRYVSVLLLLPLGVIVAEEMKRSKFKSLKVWGQVGAAGAGMLAAMIPLLWYHAEAYGGIFRTGYSAGANATSFSVAWFFEHAPAMGWILAMPRYGVSAVLLLTLVGIGVMVWKRAGWTAAMLLLWAVPPLVVYTAYYGMAKNNLLLYARFALPSFVPLVLLGAVWPAWPTQKRWAYGCVGAGAAVAILLNCFLNSAMDEELVNNQNYRFYSYAVQLTVRGRVPSGSVVICDNFTHYFTDYLDDYIVYDPAMFVNKTLQQRLDDLKKTPHEFDPVRTKQMADLLGGRTDAELAEILRGRVRAYAKQGKDVYLITTDANVRYWPMQLRMPIKLEERAMEGTLDLFKVEPDANAATAP